VTTVGCMCFASICRSSLMYRVARQLTLRCVDICVLYAVGYLHQVRSYGRSISSTNHFAPSPDLNFTDCVSPSPSNDGHLSLSQVQFMWSYVNGHLVSSSQYIFDVIVDINKHCVHSCTGDYYVKEYTTGAIDESLAVLKAVTVHSFRAFLFLVVEQKCLECFTILVRQILV